MIAEPIGVAFKSPSAGGCPIRLAAPASANSTPNVARMAAIAAPNRKRQLLWPLGRKRRASNPSDNFIPTFLNGYRPFDREITDCP